MIQTVKEGKTLLIDGPASIRLLSGKANILGAPVKVGDKLVVRKGKRAPFEALSNTEVELTLGDSATSVEIDGSSIPSSWKDAASKILSSEKYKEILVIGGVDSGKTSFCTYLANLAVGAGHKVALIDGDLGQSDIGSPGTVSLCFIQKPVIDLFVLQPEDVVFVGVTSPSRMIGATLRALATLKAKALEMAPKFLIINTDGWVEGDDAVNYKAQLVKIVEPDIVVAIRSGNELDPILNALKNVEVFAIESPKNVKKRDRETRRALRESAYKKYLKGAKVRSYPLSWVDIEGDLINAEDKYQLKRKIEEIIGKEILHCEETLDRILFVIEKGKTIREEEVKKLETEIGKRVVAFQQGDEQGLLVALENAKGKFLGIGTIFNIDFKREIIQIFTPVNDAAATIRIGRIKLDREGNEIDMAISI